jgi:hypothetical protein
LVKPLWQAKLGQPYPILIVFGQDEQITCDLPKGDPVWIVRVGGCGRELTLPEVKLLFI